MKYTKEHGDGYPLLILCERCEFDEFYKMANTLQKELNIVFVNKIDDFDSIYWEFKFEDRELILHYNIYLGVSVYPKLVKKFTSEDEYSIDKFANNLSKIQ